MKTRATREVSTTMTIAFVLVLAAVLQLGTKAAEGQGSDTSSKGSGSTASSSTASGSTVSGSTASSSKTPGTQSNSFESSKSSVSKSQSEGGKQVIANKALPLVLEQQAGCWNNGDLDGFMQSYLDSPKISYTSSGETVHGFEALKKRYVDKYGSKRDTMGELSFSDLSITELGVNDALCVGSWHLERARQPTLDGVFTLIFTNTSQGWKIIHDHTSAKVDKETRK